MTTLDYSTLELLRQNHPAWRLLGSLHAPLIVSFLQRVFVAPNVRLMTQSDLISALDDELFAWRERLGGNPFPKPALEYLNDGPATTRARCASFIGKVPTSRIST